MLLINVGFRTTPPEIYSNPLLPPPHPFQQITGPPPPTLAVPLVEWPIGFEMQSSPLMATPTMSLLMLLLIHFMEGKSDSTRSLNQLHVEGERLFFN